MAGPAAFRRRPAFFQGITTQPLRARSGIPVAARWSIVAGDTGTAVVYAEQPFPCPSSIPDGTRTAPRAPRRDRSDPPDNRDSQPPDNRDSQPGNATHGLVDTGCGAGPSPLREALWTVLESDEQLTFQYAGLDGAWQERWSPVEGVREWIPRQVRLVTSTGQTVLTATFGLYQEPLGNPRDFL